MPHSFWGMAAGAAALGVMILAGSACSNACDELTDVCARCPPDGNGPIAKASCESTVAADDEVACHERLDLRTYQAYGCY